MSRTCKCPLCAQESKLDSCDEVDIGIGVMTGNELWDCPDHGRWAVNTRDYERLSHSFSFIDMEMTLLRPFRFKESPWKSNHIQETIV